MSLLPVSGLGYIVGSQVGKVGQDWHWALRVSVCECVCVFAECGSLSHGAPPPPQVTPGLGLVAVLLLLLVVKEPRRGAVEARPEHHLQRTSWLTDLKALSRK